MDPKCFSYSQVQVINLRKKGTVTLGQKCCLQQAKLNGLLPQLNQQMVINAYTIKKLPNRNYTNVNMSYLSTYAIFWGQLSKIIDLYNVRTGKMTTIRLKFFPDGLVTSNTQHDHFIAFQHQEKKLALQIVQIGSLGVKSIILEKKELISFLNKNKIPFEEANLNSAADVQIKFFGSEDNFAVCWLGFACVYMNQTLLKCGSEHSDISYQLLAVHNVHQMFSSYLSRRNAQIRENLVIKVQFSPQLNSLIFYTLTNGLSNADYKFCLAKLNLSNNCWNRKCVSIQNQNIDDLDNCDFEIVSANFGNGGQREEDDHRFFILNKLAPPQIPEIANIFLYSYFIICD